VRVTDRSDGAMLCCQNYVTGCLEVAPYCWIFLMALFGIHIAVFKLAPETSKMLVRK
jgi:hypothetical protein